MADSALSIAGLGHQYADSAVLNGVDLEVENGEFVAVLGESGSGKTTLLRAISGLLTPSRGTIHIRGQAVLENGIEKIPPEHRGVGLVFQDYALFPHMSVQDNIAFGLSRTDTARIQKMLSLVGISELANRAPSTLSGGQQQRVALARALAPGPHLLLLDEPFANVDAERRAGLGDALYEITRAQETATLLVTHDRVAALGLADRLVVLVPAAGGAVVAQQGTPTEVYKQPTSREVATLTGPAFFISAETRGTQAQTQLGSLDLVVPSNGSATVLLRPEHLSFKPNDQGNSTIRHCAFEGPHMRLVCDTPAGEVHLFSQAPHTTGTRGQVQVKNPCWSWPHP